MIVESVAAGIERTLTLEILQGRYAPGSRLPTVRDLAARYGVTPATIQRVVDRLETRGLIEARQGSGLRVNDPHLSGDIALAPFWLLALRAQPDRAVRILDELLELRRVMAVRLLVRHREQVLAKLPELEQAAVRLLEASALGLDALREADFAFARALMSTTENFVAVSILNTLERVLEELPSVATAMYAVPAENTRSMFEVLQALAIADDQMAATVETTIAEADHRTLSRFAAAIGAIGTRP